MKKENATSLFFLTRSLFFGLGISLICKYTDKDTYIGAIIGTILGLMIILCYRYIIKHKMGSLNDLFSKNKVVGMTTRILLLLASIIILIYSLLTYKTFVSSFLLDTTPVFMILIPWLLLLIYCAWGGISMIHKVSSALFPLSIVLSLLSIASILGNFDFYNFLPILTSKPGNMFMTIIAFAGISTFPGLLTLHLNKDTKNYIRYYLLGALSIVIVILCINGVFGEVLVNVFRFPEYMVLKQVILFNFIEKIENILSIAWAFDLFITSSFALYSIKTLGPSKHNTLFTILTLGIAGILIDKFFDFNYVYELVAYYALPYISLALPIIIILLMFYLVKKRNRSKL